MNNDYYTAVYTWFEKCGIISNIRTHLRQNLVNALKGTESSFKRETSKPKSAKQYVYDLLIAEYLWNHDYMYSLSVFASEVPLLMNFHKQEMEASEEPKEAYSKQKLENDYIWHTLETLGIKPAEPEGQYIISEYAVSNVPLLLCILKCVASFTVNTRNENKTEEANKSHRQTQTDRAECTDPSEAVKLATAKRKLFYQRELYNSQLEQKEAELKKQVVLIERQFALLNEKLEEAQNLMRMVDDKEERLLEEKKRDDHRLLQKEVELSLKESLLSREADRLQKERDSYRKFEGDLRKLQDEFLKVKKDLPRVAQGSNVILKDIQVQTESGNSAIDRGERRLLNQEKQELCSLVQEQQARIEALTLRAVHLSRQLEEAHLLLRSTSIDIHGHAAREVNIHTVISEGSSTEDILQDAKMRLKRLEEETLKADQYYYKCIITSPR